MRIYNFNRIIKSGKVKNVRVIDHNGMEIHDNVNVVSTKKRCVYFKNTDGADITPKFEYRDIMVFERVHTDDNQYNYALILKDGRTFTVEFTFKGEYTPYMLYDEVIQNYNAVDKGITKYLDKLSGKKVVVNHTEHSEAFSVYADGIVTNPCSGQIVIPDFQYAVETKSKIPCIRMYSETDDSVYVVAYCVSMIDENENVVDNEFYKNEKFVYISGENGEFYLRETA